MRSLGKKLLALVLCALLFAAALPYAVAAQKDPVVFVAGYTSSRLYLDRGTPQERRVWRMKLDEKVKDAVRSELPGIAFDAAASTVGYYDTLFDRLEPYVSEVIEPLRMNDDGSSKYPVEVYPHSVEETRLDALRAVGYYPDHDSLVMLGKAAGEKNVYCCTLDWRLGQVDNAAVLDAYIRDVLRVSGAQRVDLMGVSYGGQVVASYLSLYGASNVGRVVMQCPAIDGSSIVPQLLSGQDFRIGWEDLAQLYRAFRMDERDFASLAAAVSPEFLSDFLRAFLDRFLVDFFCNFGSVWDLVPQAQYAALRDRMLRDGKHDAMIEKSDRYHNEIAPHMAETLQAVRAQGVPVSIVAGYGYALAVDNGNDSDGVIDVSSMTGADCAKLGKKLIDTDTRSLTVSPNGAIDASAGYLPDSTWYVQGLLHSMGANEEKVSALMTTLLLTDDVPDVRASAEYPQFLTSRNACRGVFCAFSGCAEGFCTRYATALEITNLSRENSITVTNVTCRGAKLRFSFPRDVTLTPGETLTAAVSGVVPEQDLTALRVTVRYAVYQEKNTAANSRTQDFRFAAGPTQTAVLTQDVTGADEIADTPAVRTGVIPPRAAAASVLYRLWSAILAVCRFVRQVRAFAI
ncbi:MAG: alpha/beta hydrolase [Clostridia bacterium]|nr:alpha/beta hydrolase [Clostridia bacterium]